MFLVLLTLEESIGVLLVATLKNHWKKQKARRLSAVVAQEKSVDAENSATFI